MLDRFVAGVRAGEGQALVVRGEPGVGKTVLLDYLAGGATSSGCRVVRATGVQSEMELAFAGLHQLCAPMLGHAESLPVPQREALRTAFGLSAGPVPDRFLVGLAVLGLLSEAAGARPLVCMVDDQQWLDRASAQALGFAARRLAAVRSGQPARAADALRRLSETTRASGTDWALGTEARSRALLSEGETAENCYREATERLGRSRMRPALARAHLLYGEWLRREKRRRDARAELRTAHDLFDEMGIDAFAERARHELLATGETVRKRTVETVSELTAQEAHIARLAVDGRTNVEIGAQLFLSTRTVEWHLGKVYTKLEVGSRRELPRALASRGQADPQA